MATAVQHIYPISNNAITRAELLSGTPGPVLSQSPTGGVGYTAGAGTTITQAAVILAAVAVIGVAGQCTCTAPATALAVGTPVTVSGTIGAGTATGLSATTFYVMASTTVGAVTTFQLATSSALTTPITTTAGTVGSFVFTANTGATRTSAIYTNSLTGSITLVSAAGSATYAHIVVNNTSIGAGDTVTVSHKSGSTDTYGAFGTTVAAGSFKLSYVDLSGTTTEAPVFNYTIIKGSAV